MSSILPFNTQISPPSHRPPTSEDGVLPRTAQNYFYNTFPDTARVNLHALLDEKQGSAPSLRTLLKTAGTVLGSNFNSIRLTGPETFKILGFEYFRRAMCHLGFRDDSVHSLAVEQMVVACAAPIEKVICRISLNFSCSRSLRESLVEQVRQNMAAQCTGQCISVRYDSDTKSGFWIQSGSKQLIFVFSRHPMKPNFTIEAVELFLPPNVLDDTNAGAKIIDHDRGAQWTSDTFMRCLRKFNASTCPDIWELGLPYLTKGYNPSSETSPDLKLAAENTQLLVAIYEEYVSYNLNNEDLCLQALFHMCRLISNTGTDPTPFFQGALLEHDKRWPFIYERYGKSWWIDSCILVSIGLCTIEEWEHLTAFFALLTKSKVPVEIQQTVRGTERLWDISYNGHHHLIHFDLIKTFQIIEKTLPSLLKDKYFLCWLTFFSRPQERVENVLYYDYDPITQCLDDILTRAGPAGYLIALALFSKNPFLRTNFCEVIHTFPKELQMLVIQRLKIALECSHPGDSFDDTSDPVQLQFVRFLIQHPSYILEGISLLAKFPGYAQEKKKLLPRLFSSHPVQAAQLLTGLDLTNEETKMLLKDCFQQHLALSALLEKGFVQPCVELNVDACVEVVAASPHLAERVFHEMLDNPAAQTHAFALLARHFPQREDLWKAAFCRYSDSLQPGTVDEATRKKWARRLLVDADERVRQHGKNLLDQEPCTLEVLELLANHTISASDAPRLLQACTQIVKDREEWPDVICTIVRRCFEHVTDPSPYSDLLLHPSMMDEICDEAAYKRMCIVFSRLLTTMKGSPQRQGRGLLEKLIASKESLGHFLEAGTKYPPDETNAHYRLVEEMLLLRQNYINSLLIAKLRSSREATVLNLMIPVLATRIPTAKISSTIEFQALSQLLENILTHTNVDIKITLYNTLFVSPPGGKAIFPDAIFAILATHYIRFLDSCLAGNEEQARAAAHFDLFLFGSCTRDIQQRMRSNMDPAKKLIPLFIKQLQRIDYFHDEVSHTLFANLLMRLVSSQGGATLVTITTRHTTSSIRSYQYSTPIDPTQPESDVVMRISSYPQVLSVVVACSVSSNDPTLESYRTLTHHMVRYALLQVKEGNLNSDQKKLLLDFAVQLIRNTVEQFGVDKRMIFALDAHVGCISKIDPLFERHRLIALNLLRFIYRQGMLNVQQNVLAHWLKYLNSDQSCLQSETEKMLNDITEYAQSQTIEKPVNIILHSQEALGAWQEGYFKESEEYYTRRNAALKNIFSLWKRFPDKLNATIFEDMQQLLFPNTRLFGSDKVDFLKNVWPAISLFFDTCFELCEQKKSCPEIVSNLINAMANHLFACKEKGVFFRNDQGMQAILRQFFKICASNPELDFSKIEQALDQLLRVLCVGLYETTPEARLPMYNEIIQSLLCAKDQPLTKPLAKLACKYMMPLLLTCTNTDTLKNFASLVECCTNDVRRPLIKDYFKHIKQLFKEKTQFDQFVNDLPPSFKKHHKKIKY